MSRPFHMRWQLVNLMAQTLGHRTYLEIGCRGVKVGECFNKVLIHTMKHGVDPQPMEHEEYPGDNVVLHEMTSDQFFTTMLRQLTFDTIFIDGLHTSAQVMKDVRNSLLRLNDGGAIICHDCNPRHSHMQRTGRNGTCWQAIVELRCTALDVDVCVINADQGLAVIRKRDELRTVPALQITNKDWRSWLWFKKNREHALNLQSVQQFNTWFWNQGR